MLFNSIPFLYFFIITTALYFILPHRYRWALLLGASCYFYMAFIPKYILILAFTIVVDYCAGIMIEKSKGKQRKWFLVASIIANVGVLALFKYFDFFSGNINDVARWIGWNYSVPLLKIILPVGLSFHTFQAMSYTIEVYRGRQKAERHFGIYALYVMFFPQLVAGPIERPQNLLHQFYEHHYFEYDRVTQGLKLMAWGLFKKIVIADRLALVVGQVFNNYHDYSGPIFIIAALFFAYQIYCDFSGYSDIAIGAAEVLGFRLMNNFNRPYSARSIAEFWRKWHISLSSWFKDYVYIPLGGNKVSLAKWTRNILIVFVLSGFWHGANWTFIVWGALHGVMIIFSRWSNSVRAQLKDWLGGHYIPRIYRAAQMFITFVLVDITWVFFRATSISQATYILVRATQNLSSIFSQRFWRGLPAALHIGAYNFMLAVAVVIILELIQYWCKEESFQKKLSKQPIWVRWPIYYVLVLCLLFLSVRDGQQFIYFQF